MPRPLKPAERRPVAAKPAAWLELLSAEEKRQALSFIGSWALFESPNQELVTKALLLSKKERIPLLPALEICTCPRAHEGILKVKRAAEFLRNLKSAFEIETRNGGRFTVTPALFTRTGSSRDPNFHGVNDLTWMAFRIMPCEEEKHLYEGKFDIMTKKDPYRSAIVVEVGLGEIGSRPVIVVTNAQATRDYYSLPWALKKKFKGSYDQVLEIIRQASGKAPLLIPTNATVKEYLAKGLNGHKVGDSVLNEFYDRFCEKRKRRRAVLTVRNALSKKRVTAEFWV